jgi:hypothetical protein
MRLYSTAIALNISPHLAGVGEHICHAEKTLVGEV